MQCRHAVFNIGRPRLILDIHAWGIYSLNTLVKLEVWSLLNFDSHRVLLVSI
jgi:hypothetical protein